MILYSRKNTEKTLKHPNTQHTPKNITEHGILKKKKSIHSPYKQHTAYTHSTKYTAHNNQHTNKKQT